MIGRELNLDHIERNNKYDKTVIELKNLTQKNVFKDISFSVKQGEILGMYGLIGAGRTEVAEAIFGIRKIDSGEIYINDQLADINSSEKAVKNGIALVPEDRKEQGLVLEMSCKENLTLSILQTIGNFGFLNHDLEKTLMLEYKDLLSIKMADINDKISTLSGGNQQKIIIGKWLVTNPKLLILDEPTRGIDIGSKAEIHNLIRKLANEGYAILVISSEMPEVISLSDRVLVLRDGRISGEFSGRDITEEDLALTI
jgi:ribose transport system ATP-binding protein